LDGKVILVTGAGQGLGRGIAQSVSEEGARVIVTDIRLPEAEETARLVGSSTGPALPLLLDVTDADTIRQAINRAVEAFGQLDGWVNNAGVIKMGAALDFSLQDWNWHFGVHVAGLFECCRLFARHCIQRTTAIAAEGGPRSRGSIVNVASNAGKVGYPNMAAYNASKAAVINLTRSLAAEWATHNINVNAVCPGGVATSMLRSVAEWVVEQTGGDADDIYHTMTPHQLGRHVQPAEVGRVVAFLLSDRAQIIRGQSINVDGGDTPY
jgi:meso-butanediol dehydrogenase/(S,S)-butanediol dehydrogenase/diacetyl reductase